MKRMKLKMKPSQRLFTRTAKKVHPKNNLSSRSFVMRGGIRF